MESESLIFAHTMSEYDLLSHPDNVVHILCVDGNMRFPTQRTRYNVSRGDYVILTPGILVADFMQSDDCRLIIMSFKESIAAKCTIENDYGIIGYLSLFQNPVIRLDEADFRKCFVDMKRLEERSMNSGHLFYEEMLRAMLKAHILDLYDIHARNNTGIISNTHPAALMRKFISMLVEGDYKKDRTVGYYASELCVTPHYLSEISTMFSKRTATYWIDRFVIKEITQLLIQKDISFTEIADRLRFSSVSYLTRYVNKHFGATPSELRKSLN